MGNEAIDDYLFDLRGYLILENAIDAGHVADLNAAFDAFPSLEWGEWWGNVQRFDNNGAAGIELQNIVEAGEPFERLIDGDTGYWLAFPESRRNVPKIRYFRDWIVAEMASGRLPGSDR